MSRSDNLKTKSVVANTTAPDGIRSSAESLSLHPTLDRSLVVGIGLLVALLIASALVSFWNVYRLRADANWVDHTHRVLAALDEVIETVRDAESGQRGYIITGSTDYLELYHGASTRASTLIVEVERLTADNPRQQARAQDLKAAVTARLDVLRQHKDIYDNQGFEAARASIQGNHGLEQMLTLRAIVDAMTKEETDLLDVRSQQAKSAYYTTNVADILSTILGLIAVAAFVRALRKHLAVKAMAATQLWEEREQFHTTLSSIGDGVITTDTASRVLFINAVAETLTGWTAADARGEKLAAVMKIINEYTREAAVNPVDRVLNEGVTVGLANHTILLRKGGGEIPIDDSAAPIRGQIGNVTGCVFVFRDIAERRQAENEIQRLLANEQRRAGQLRKLTDAALTLNSATTRDSVVGVVTEEAKQVFEVVDAVLHWQETASVPNGTVAAPLIARNGKPFGYLHLNLKADDSFSADDETALAQLANLAAIAVQNAELYEELRTSNHHKTEFLATLAHELRNPLAPIRNSLQLMEISPQDPQLLEQSRSMIERQVIQMVRLIDDLLDISRISRGKIELRKEHIDLSSVVTAAVEASRPLIDGRHHHLTIDVPKHPIPMYGDATRLSQVVLNLLNNAAKYTTAGGQIRLTVEDSPQSVSIKVRDNGIGIPREMLTQVFEMFTQVDRSLERTEGGLGIGLTLVKRLVELHEGSVEVRSEGEAKGSEFVVTLPKLDSEAIAGDDSRNPLPQAPKPGQSLLRIVAVDDNRDAVDSLAKILRMKGHDVQTAYDGVEALEVVGSFKPRVVLLDIGLPRLNGYEVAQRIRQLPGVGQIVLIAVTGWGQDEDRKRSHASGFDMHLVKPVDPLALDQLIANIVNSQA